jgi:hypothetical protein
MAQGTIAYVMGGWRISDMATCAFGDVGMVEGVWFPVGDEMASGAIALEMGFGRLVALAANGGGVGKDAIAVARFASDVMTAIKGEKAVVNIL